MLKKLLFILIIFNIALGMEQSAQDQESASITDHADAWRYIAEYLPGDNLFLNTNIARNIELDKKTREKIIEAFLERIKGLDQNKAAYCFRHFFDTSHLELEHNLLKNFLPIKNEFFKHYDECCNRIYQNPSCPKCNQYIHQIFSLLNHEKVNNILEYLIINKPLSRKARACQALYVVGSPFIHVVCLVLVFILINPFLSNH